MISVVRLKAAIFVTLLCASTAVAVQTPPDSTTTDSLRSRVLPHVGRARLAPVAYAAGADLWQWTDARSFHHVFGALPGVFLRDVGEAGKPMTASYLGSDIGTEGIAQDGIPIGDLFTGRPNLSTMPLEFFEGVEQLNAPEAIFSGARWNLVSRQIVSPKPVTRFRFFQESHETLFSDGMFSQNVARSTTAYFGFQRHTSEGRYHNGRLDSWNLRGRLRANILESLNFIGSWMYEKTSNGLNGGVDRFRTPSTSEVFDEVLALVHDENAYDVLTRTDLALTAVARPFDDSLSTTRMIVGSSEHEREYRNPADVYSFYNFRQFSRARTLRLRVEQNVNLSVAVLRLFTASGTTKIDSTDLYLPRSERWSSAGIGVEGTLTRYFVPSVSLTTEERYGDRRIAMGAALRAQAGEFVAHGSYGRSPRFPTLLELYRTDSLLLRMDMPKTGLNELTTVSLRWEPDSAAFIEVLGYRRVLSDVPVGNAATTASGMPAILLSNTTMEWRGISFSGRIPYWKLALSGSVTFANAETAGSTSGLLPSYWGMWEIAYHDRLADDKLELNVALRSRFANGLEGSFLDPASLQEVLHVGEHIGAAATLDAVGVLHIGDAFITVAWENLANAKYLRSYLYPMPERRFKLGVNWVFLD